MNGESWLHFLIFIVLALLFSSWTRRKGFVLWKRAVLHIIFVVVFFLTWNLLRGKLV